MYLKKHHLLTYVEDALCLLLTRREEDSKTTPFQLLSGYFKSVLDGSHVVFREHNFVSATPHNRRSFLAVLWQTYSGVQEIREQTMRLVELHSLLRLLCADFPLRETERVAMALYGHTAASSITSFTEFAYTFQVTFYFDCFLRHLKSMIPSLVTGAYIPPLYPQFSSATVIVPLPSTTTTSPSSPSDTSKSLAHCGHSPATSEAEVCGKNVSGEVLLEAALGLCRRMREREPGESCPSQESLREVLEGVEQLSLNEFVVKLSLSGRVCREIGALPCRTT